MQAWPEPVSWWELITVLEKARKVTLATRKVTLATTGNSAGHSTGHSTGHSSNNRTQATRKVTLATTETHLHGVTIPLTALRKWPLWYWVL
jgi:uncharacterized cupin superfamily protein